LKKSKQSEPGLLAIFLIAQDVMKYFNYKISQNNSVKSGESSKIPA